jgi:ribonuclease P protein component
LSDSPQGRLRLRPAQRVRRSADFDVARESGRRFDAGWFLLWARKRDDDRPARLGVAASRAVGGAVVRNRCKRVLRELFRRHQHEIPPGTDLVISARRSLPGIGTEDLDKRFLKTLRRIVGEPSVQK